MAEDTEALVTRGMVIVHRLIEEQATGCPVCGSSMSSEDCWDCGGEGYHDMHEMNPNEYEPGEEERCETCDGHGAIRFCLNAKNHPPEES